MSKNNFLEVEILWPPRARKEAFKGQVKAVSSKNHLGDFDILPGHANFISLISNNLIVRTPEKKINYQFARGILQVNDNRVKIFLGL